MLLYPLKIFLTGAVQFVVVVVGKEAKILFGELW